MTVGRFELNVADLSGTESTFMRHDDARVLLEIRDTKREDSDPRSVSWRVLDSNDYEIGDVEWCPECDGGGGFDSEGEWVTCDECGGAKIPERFA